MFDLIYKLLLKIFKGTDTEFIVSQKEWKEGCRESITRFTKGIVYTLLGLVATFAAIMIIGWAISPNDAPAWTGFGEHITAKGEVVPAKTLWDWMDLLVVSIVIAIGVFLLNQTARRNERAIEEQKSKRERQISTDQRRQKTLENYLDKMGELLIDKGLRKPDKDEPHTVARARTLAALRSLGWDKASDMEPDGERRAYILKFLHESELIEREKAIVDLTGAELDHVNLEKADLIQTDLSECSLVSANLGGADLRKVCLDDANMMWANLNDAKLDEAFMRKTHLRSAVARRCNLTKTDLSGAFLSEADLRGANLDEAILRNTDLSNANLVGTSLCGADLCGANLSMAKVEGTLHEELPWLVEGMSEEEIKSRSRLMAKYLHVNLSGAKYDERTKWPCTTFDPQTHGAVPMG